MIFSHHKKIACDPKFSGWGGSPSVGQPVAEVERRFFITTGSTTCTVVFIFSNARWFLKRRDNFDDEWSRDLSEYSK